MQDLDHDAVLVGLEVDDLFPKVVRFDEADRFGVGHANRLVASHFLTSVPLSF